MRKTSPVLGLACTALLLAAACGPDANDDPPATQEAPGEPEMADEQADEAEPLSVAAEFGPYEEGAEAVTYDEEAAPEGAEVEVDVLPDGNGGTEFQITVWGLEPEEEFGAHLHTDECGADPGDSGPHYQDEVDPEANGASVDPEYANPENEVWLDFITDEEGDGSAQASVAWAPRPGEAASVVLHEEHTSTEEGEAGTAGDRLACVNVPL